MARARPQDRRLAVAECARRGRSGGRRLGLDRRRLSFGQRSVHGDGAGAVGRAERGGHDTMKDNGAKQGCCVKVDRFSPITSPI